MDRRQQMCERRQPRRTPKVEPLPPVHGCPTAEEAAHAEWERMVRRRYGHVIGTPDAVRQYVVVEGYETEGAPQEERDEYGRLVCRAPTGDVPAWVSETARLAREGCPYNEGE